MFKIPASRRVAADPGFAELSTHTRLSALLALATLVAIGSGCGKSGSDATPATPPNSFVAVAKTDAVAPTDIVTKSGIEMVYLPGGTFMMGSAQGNPDEAPVHKVELSGFLMDKFEVAQELFAKVQLPNPSHWQDSARKSRSSGSVGATPSSTATNAPCWKGSSHATTRRPRTGTVTPRPTAIDCPQKPNGNTPAVRAQIRPYDFGAADKLRSYAWFADNADQKTHAVGQKKAKPVGHLRSVRQCLRVVRRCLQPCLL